MPLLAPLFLVGLAAVAVPLLVHLVHREKRDPIAFPSLMFLEVTPAPFTARRNLRDPWLFLLRALAVVALALAFARPVLGPRPVIGGVDQRRREVIVLLDRSFSMQVGDRWARAKAAVDSVIRTLAPGDRLTLVPFDRRASAVTAATSDAVQLRAGLDSLRPTDESTRLAPALSLAQQRFAASDAPRKALVIVSDMQRSAWDLADESRLPAGTELAALDVSGAAAIADRAVRSVDVRRDRTATGPAQAIVSARVANVGVAARGVVARLEVGGRVLAEKTVDLPQDGGAVVTFPAVPVPPAALPARVVLTADAVPGDDAFHFLLQQAPALGVLVVDSRDGPFLTRALAIGDAPHFDVITRTPSRVGASDLTTRRLVILADGAFPTGLGAARLLRFVEDGGGLIVALGDQMNPRAWTAARVLLPGQVRAPIDRGGGQGAVLGALDQRHPALALLAGARAGDLSAARFHRYRAIDTTAGVLARFDDGSAALTEHAVGRGRVITFGSTFDGQWNDLPRQPAFLPLVQQLARYAASWRDDPRAFEIGASVRPSDLAGARTGDSARWVATAPSGRRITVGGSGAPPALELAEAGVFELRPGGTPGARPLLVAANIAPAELDFASFDALRLTTALTSAPGSPGAAAPSPVEETLADREARQSTWWYLLLAAALLLIAESIVARRAASATQAVGGDIMQSSPLADRMRQT